LASAAVVPQGAGAIFLSTLIALVSSQAVEGSRILGGWRVIIWLALAVSFLVWLATTELGWTRLQNYLNAHVLGPEGGWLGSRPSIPLASSDPDGDLLLEILQEQWHNHGHIAHIVEAKVRITNRSSVPKRISGRGTYMQLALKIQPASIASDVERIADELRQTKPQIKQYDEIPPGEHVEGWWVVAMDFGPPEYQLMIHDELNNEYRVRRPAMRGKTHAG
jgi:hypothetical protein